MLVDLQTIFDLVKIKVEVLSVASLSIRRERSDGKDVLFVESIVWIHDVVNIIYHSNLSLI